jgi:hypothetical protein
VVDEIQQEGLAVVLDRVEAEAFQPELFPDPGSPGFNVVLYFFVRIIEIGEHEVVYQSATHTARISNSPKFPFSVSTSFAKSFPSPKILNTPFSPVA